jgi:hypothetical protein
MAAQDSLAQADELCARAESLETLHAAYAAWNELREVRAAEALASAAERRRLDEQGAFLLGAVRSATDPSAEAEGEAGDSALARASDAQAFLSEAESKLGGARAHLAERERQHGLAHARAEARLVEVILGRVKRPGPKPALVLRLRTLSQGRVILHLDRLRGDDPVKLFFLLTGLVPTHENFLDDESTDDLHAGPLHFYRGEGVADERLRPTAPQLKAMLSSMSSVAPVRAALPFLDPAGRLWRFVPRGPVLELELAEGDGFRNLLTRLEGEEGAGVLLKLRLAGQVDLTLEAS